MLNPGQISAFERDGFVIVRGLFSNNEVVTLREHFMHLRAEGPKPDDVIADSAQTDDPLVKFPRMIHMHRWDDITRRWLIDPRIGECLHDLWGEEALAVQSMLYFKPPGARGQAMHQDQYYLLVKPGTCMAAWMPLDRCDVENGCMRLIPGSHKWPLLCAAKADSKLSFSGTAVPIPENQPVVDAVMEAGDVLFFTGYVVHGSLPNLTTDRFRRALIGHFVPSSTTELTAYDQPVIRMDGTEARLQAGKFGGPCGEWVDRDGEPVLELAGHEDKPLWERE